MTTDQTIGKLRESNCRGLFQVNPRILLKALGKFIKC